MTVPPDVRAGARGVATLFFGFADFLGLTVAGFLWTARITLGFFTTGALGAALIGLAPTVSAPEPAAGRLGPGWANAAGAARNMTDTRVGISLRTGPPSSATPA